MEGIAGAQQLMAVFGYWPSFHDAEVLSIKLDRMAIDESDGPILEATVHVFEMTSEVDSTGHYVLRHHVLAHLRFDDVVELTLEGFNHQNALFGLGIKDIRERQLERIRWEVSFDPSWGVGASFQCYGVEVVSVTPCDKDGKPLKDVN
jgi:hypothetical protein